ncbi:GNAT family N-acetyltransferase [Nocardioides jiangxiensis]|uniref:GNAT family N-acetyltransferase n=1 Tax=Nocardioides jiangxiensis TaxID=3064524 RepID=A0ABT9B5Z1_9ACTN|nr:GNAT family N-acetyltransferase [Nocardioides sp. WY-20]MDO7868726.1 GNAT family N-acetyltransferase [Nocardioides sp. WY-20]
MIRPATVDDAAAIAALEPVLFPGDAWSREQVAEELSGYGRRGWVLLTSSAAGEPGSAAEVAGYVIMRTVADVSDLQRIGVAPDGQRSGVASQLMDVALDGVREDGAERVLLEVAEDNAAARALYARFGFVEIDRRPRYYRSGAAALVLELALPAQGR